MEKLNKSLLEIIRQPTLWGVLSLCETLGLFWILKEWHEYPVLNNLTLTEIGQTDPLHAKLLYVACISLLFFLITTINTFLRSLSLPHRQTLYKKEEEKKTEDTIQEILSDSAIPVFHIKTTPESFILYQDKAIKISPRIATLLNALKKKENQSISLEELNNLFYPKYYDETEQSISRIRNLKSLTHKALLETPFDVIWATSGGLRLIQKDEKEKD